MDALEILLVFAPIPLIWGLWCKLWDWTLMWCAIALIVVGVEIASTYPMTWLMWVSASVVAVGVFAAQIAVGIVNKNLKKTISRHFWLFEQESKWNFFKAICCVASVLTFFVYLCIVHLILKFYFLKLLFH